MPHVLNHSSVRGHFDSFWVSDVVNSATVTIEVQLFLQNIDFRADWSKVELALLFPGLWGTSALICIAGVPGHSAPAVWKGSISSTSYQALFLSGPLDDDHVDWCVRSLTCIFIYIALKAAIWGMKSCLFFLLSHRLIIHLLKVPVWQWAWFRNLFEMSRPGLFLGRYCFCPTNSKC